MPAWLVVAQIAAGPAVPRDTLPPPSWAAAGEGLPVSSFLDAQMVGRTVDVYCPHTDSPSAVLVIAPDRDVTRRQLAPVARTYASLGYVTVVPELADLATVAHAPVPQRDDEPGCATTGLLGVLGLGEGGREAMKLGGIATAISIFAGFEAVPVHHAPVLIVEREAWRLREDPSVWAYNVSGTMLCDFLSPDAACWADRREGWSPEREQAERDVAAKRRAFVIGDTVPFLHVLLDHDERARHFLAGSHGLYGGPPMGLYADDLAMSPSHTLFSLAFELGYGSESGLRWGGRTELVYRRHREKILRGIGVGAYGELAHDSDGESGSAGLQLVGYSGRGTAIAPSFGMYSTNHDEGMRAGLFFGWRGGARRTSWDMPLGLRVDADMSLDASHATAVTVTYVADLRGMLYGVGELVALGMVPRN